MYKNKFGWIRWKNPISLMQNIWHFLHKKFYFFTPQIILFLHQFFYTANVPFFTAIFFTPIFLVFYTKISLHQFLYQKCYFLTPNFEIFDHYMTAIIFFLLNNTLFQNEESKSLKTVFTKCILIFIKCMIFHLR